MCPNGHQLVEGSSMQISTCDVCGKQMQSIWGEVQIVEAWLPKSNLITDAYVSLGCAVNASCVQLATDRSDAPMAHTSRFTPQTVGVIAWIFSSDSSRHVFTYKHTASKQIVQKAEICRKRLTLSACGVLQSSKPCSRLTR